MNVLTWSKTENKNVWSYDDIIEGMYLISLSYDRYCQQELPWEHFQVFLYLMTQ